LAIVCVGDYPDIRKCGTIDKTGNEVAPFKYYYITDFFGDMAKVELGGKCGFIDRAGKEVIPLKYDSATGFYDEKTAEVTRDGAKYRIDKQGNETYVGLAPTPSTASPTNTMSNYSNTNPNKGNYSSNYSNVNRSNYSNVNRANYSNNSTRSISNNSK
jgi:hypothetical protein